MKFSLSNIGKVAHANIEIKGIAVIAGENDTGKSTVGKALYAVFNSLHNSENQIERDRRRSIERSIERALYGPTRRGYDSLPFRLYEESDINELLNAGEDLSAIDKVLGRLYGDFDLPESALNNLRLELASLARISDDEAFLNVLSRSLVQEFNGQVTNLISGEAGHLSLRIKGEEFSAFVLHDAAVSSRNRFSLITEAIYLDDPFVLDDVFPRRPMASDHRGKLRVSLRKREKQDNVFEQINTSRKLEVVTNSLNSICQGEVVSVSGSRLGYQAEGMTEPLDIRSLSTGLKTFVILKMLLQNGTLAEGGTVILDEPEIHLHPEWQLVLAEIVVLLQKQFAMHILINTHSPYFLNAIEVYAAKHSIADKCTYYLARLEDKLAVIDDVSDNTEAIYAKLAKPLQRLENEAYRND